MLRRIPQPPFAPKLSKLKREILWLRYHNVPLDLLAGIFQTTPNELLVLINRARGPSSREEKLLVSPLGKEMVDDSFEPSDNELFEALGVRETPDLEATESSDETRQEPYLKIDRLEEEIENRWQQFAEEYRFLEGIDGLRALTPQIGYSNDPRRMRLLARLHQHIGWFFTHEGFETASIEHAMKARWLSELVYRQTGDPLDLRRLAQASLIASNACLLSCRPQRAQILLDIADEAVIAAGGSPGGDHHRQRGVSFLQQEKDAEARSEFVQATEAMKRLGEAPNEGYLALFGNRQLNLLNQNWDGKDGALELLTKVKRHYKSGSVEYSMIVNWTAACGLAVDSKPINVQALEILDKNQASTRIFAHQATVSQMLAITPNLPAKVRPLWIYRALYANAFRQQ